MLRQALIQNLHLNAGTLTRNLEEVDHEMSLSGPQPGGNTINWVLGHLIHARNLVLAILQEEQVGSEAILAPYVRGSGPLNASNAVALDELRDFFTQSQQRLLHRLESMDDGELKRELYEPVPPLNQTVLGLVLAGFVFHDSYHCGQLGVLRRLLGLNGALG